jgi:hypothetical protein
MAGIFEVLTGRALNPAALTALTMNTGDTLSVRSFAGATPILLGMWSQQATAGFIRVRSPRMHDPVQGIRLAAPAALPIDLLPDETRQVLAPTDTLIAEIQGGGAETDSMALLVYYDGLSGQAANLGSWDQVKPQIVNVLGQQIDVAGPAVTGDWSAGTNLTNFTDQFHANRNYAVLGYQLDTASLAVAIRGPDTGNYKMGGPGVVQPIETRDWFVSLSKNSGYPCIPIVNAQNKGGTQVFVSKVGAGGTINVTLIMAELSS